MTIIQNIFSLKIKITNSHEMEESIENNGVEKEGTTNFYKFTEKQDQLVNPNYMKSHVFPVPFRAAIIAASGAGKTNTILNILNKMSGTFMKVILCIPTAEEPLYELLKVKLGDKLEIYCGEVKKGIRKNKCAMPNIPPIDDVAEKDLDGWIPKLMIFDDLLLFPDQSDIETYYIRGRKKALSSMYASQSFYRIPITIRRNLSHLLLKRNVLRTDLKKIYNLCSLEITFEQFIHFYRECTSNMEDFMIIDLEKSALFKNFETTPLYSTYEFESQVKRAAENASDEHKSRERKYSTNHQDNVMRDIGVDSYIKILEDNRVNIPVCLQELHAKHTQYATDQNFPPTTKHFLSRKLGMKFERRKAQDGQIYFLI